MPPLTKPSDDDEVVASTPPVVTVHAKRASTTVTAAAQNATDESDSNVIPFHDLSITEKEAQIKLMSKLDVSFVGCDDDEEGSEEFLS